MLTRPKKLKSPGHPPFVSTFNPIQHPIILLVEFLTRPWYEYRPNGPNAEFGTAMGKMMLQKNKLQIIFIGNSTWL